MVVNPDWTLYGSRRVACQLRAGTEARPYPDPIKWRACLLLLLLVAACSAPQITVPKPTRTCVVLSVGEFYGIAHAGALAELKRRGVAIDCVVGNSMGAIIGGLYASDPQADPVARTRALLHAYVAESEREFDDNKLTNLAKEAIKRTLDIDLGAFRKLDHARFVRVYDRFVRAVTIEGLPVPFATFHQHKDGGGLQLVEVRHGPLAFAVGSSAANPFLFDDVDVKVAERLDPGADRLSMVPVGDACRLFPGARLIAVNVSGEPVARPAGMACPVVEIGVPRRAINREEAATGGAEFEALVNDGRAAVRGADIELTGPVRAN